MALATILFGAAVPALAQSKFEGTGRPDPADDVGAYVEGEEATAAGESSNAIGNGASSFGAGSLSFANWASAFGFNGGLNASAATLALNGTANTGGSTTQVIPNTNIVYNQLPITAANALDVWNAAGAGNRTSAAVIAGLRDDSQNSHLVSGMSQARLQPQGTLFELPAGPVKLAIGGEAYRVSLYEYLAQGQGAGPTSNSAVYRQ